MLCFQMTSPQALKQALADAARDPFLRFIAGLVLAYAVLEFIRGMRQ